MKNPKTRASATALGMASWSVLSERDIPERDYGKDPIGWPRSDNAPECEVKTDGIGRIIWKGRQWAVTDYGIELCNGKKYEINKSSLVCGSGYSWVQHMGEKGWVDMPDFIAALGVAFLFHRHDGGQK